MASHHKDGETFDGLENYITKYPGFNLDSINSEEEMDKAIERVYNAEYPTKGKKANVIYHFYKNRAYLDSDVPADKIKSRLQQVESQAESTLREIDNAQTFSDLRTIESRYGTQDRFKTQIKVVQKRLKKISDDTASDAIDQISNASSLELRVINPDEYRDRVTDNALRRIKSAFNDRKQELHREGEL